MRSSPSPRPPPWASSHASAKMPKGLISGVSPSALSAPFWAAEEVTDTGSFRREARPVEVCRLPPHLQLVGSSQTCQGQPPSEGWRWGASGGGCSASRRRAPWGGGKACATEGIARRNRASGAGPAACVPCTCAFNTASDQEPACEPHCCSRTCVSLCVRVLMQRQVLACLMSRREAVSSHSPERACGHQAGVCAESAPGAGSSGFCLLHLPVPAGAAPCPAPPPHRTPSAVPIQY